MKTLPSDELEIIGFNGAVLSACGRALVVARHKPTGRCFKLEDRVEFLEPTTGYTRSEIEPFQEEGCLTLFPTPLPILPKARAVYLTEEFVESMELSNPSDLSQDLSWQEISGTVGKIWAAVADAESVEQRMNEWGRELEAKTDDLLMRFFSEGNQKSVRQAERTAKLALCAARDPKLRANIYLGYGAAILLSPTHKRLRNLYQYILRPQIPTWSWDDFREGVLGHVDTLKARERVLRSSRSRRRGQVAPGTTNPTQGLSEDVMQSLDNLDRHVSQYGDLWGTRNIFPNNVKTPLSFLYA